jgi:hypothetical protein
MPLRIKKTLTSNIEGALPLIIKNTLLRGKKSPLELRRPLHIELRIP